MIATQPATQPRSNNNNRHRRRPSTASVTQRSRRNSTASAASQPTQKQWVRQARTQSGNKPAAPLNVVTVNYKTGQKKTQQQPKKTWTKEDKIRAIHNKGDKVGKISGGIWYKAPKNGAPNPQPAQYRQRPAAPAKKQTSVRRRRQTKKQTTTKVHLQRRVCASPETLKTLRKLRKKVRQCAKIQENGQRSQSGSERSRETQPTQRRQTTNCCFGTTSVIGTNC